MLYGDAALDASLAASALSAEMAAAGSPGLQEGETAEALVAGMFAQEARYGAGSEELPGYPRKLDGSDIESVTVKWLTPDSADDGDDSLLYRVPAEDNPFSVVYQLDYALSGEFDYAPGDIRITLPATVFKTRDGVPAGNLVLPLVEAPGTRTDFNYMRVGDEYVITNAKAMAAATKGFIQLEISGLTPHELVDMAETDALQAEMQVTTHRGNTIGLLSNKLGAQADTAQEVTLATKRASDAPTVVNADKVTQAVRDKYPDEDSFVLVDWYAFAYHEGNQPYTLTALDAKADGYDGVIMANGDTSWSPGEPVQSGWHREGNSPYTRVQTAYPISQFQQDDDYVFENSITYTLAPIDGVDEPTTQTATATASWSYHEPDFVYPPGHFMVYKYGNDNAAGGWLSEGVVDGYLRYRSDTSDNETGDLTAWYGEYTQALNRLRDGDDAEVAYTVETIGYMLPWTCEGDARVAGNYGKRPVTMTTEDAGLLIRAGGILPTQLQEGADYDFTGLGFTKPTIRKIKAINVNPDGSFSAQYAGDGTFEYQRDYDDGNQPDIVLELEMGGEWVEWARASYKTGACAIELSAAAQSAGATTDAENAVVSIPEQATNWRTKVTGEKANAAISYYVRPIVAVHPTDSVKALVEDRFARSSSPIAYLYNSVRMQATDYDGEELVTLSDSGYDRLRGYSADVYALPNKSGEVNEDVNYGTGLITLSYKATVEERSYIGDEDLYRQVLADGDIAPEESCTWYDLLPAGVTPLVGTVKLRSGDTVTDKYAVQNWRGTGRTMLVVKADLEPTPVPYGMSGQLYYMDRPEVSFDAVYNTSSLFDQGTSSAEGESRLWSVTHHNVIAFESGNDSVGTVRGYSGEPDDPDSSNNVVTRSAFSSSASEAALERAALSDLDPDRNTPSFLYAGAYTTATALTSAATSLSKEVSVNGDGVYSHGTRADRRDVYEGGRYDYEVRAMSNSETRTTDMVFYDSLENFQAGQGNDEADIGAPRWQGELVSVDTSSLAAKGIAPVVYYSTVENLQVQDTTDPTKGSAATSLGATTDGGEAVWVKASEFAGSPADVKAIAVDCRKASDGSDYVLDPLEAASFRIYMAAPRGEDAASYIAQDAHAYNNIYLSCVSADASTGAAGETHLIRDDYVKVGLVEHNVTAKKVWDDADDQDGKRPESVTLALYRNGELWDPTGIDGFEDFENPVTLSAADAGADGAWAHAFEHLPYCEDDGTPIRWTVRETDATGRAEQVPDGYAATTDVAADGTVTITNAHVPERVTVAGEKTWALADESLSALERAARPASIQVRLLADGEQVRARTVRAASDGAWAYSFDGLPRYRDHGVEIEYAVAEQASPAGSLDSYVQQSSGHDLANTYHPYGDAVFSKALSGATDRVAGAAFTFDVTIVGADGAPVFDEFAYAVSDASGGTVSEGSIATNGAFQLADGQSIRVSELPEGAVVTAAERPQAGWAERSGGERTVTVKPNETAATTLTNTYRTSALLNLRAEKSLDGRAMANGQFLFYLHDGSGAPVKAAVSQADGTVTFGAIAYGNADDGKTFTYTMREVGRGKAGYTYDATEYQVDVAVSDNGDGTMTAEPTYYRVTDETTDPVTRVALAQGELPAFENAYRASGQVTLRAWKELVGGSIADWDGQFKFELLAPVEGRDFDPDDDTTYAVVQGAGADASDPGAAANQPAAADAHGEATFLPLRYDQYDAGKTYTYFIREVDSGDAKVTYSDEVYGYTVTVADNGDGTLSCAYAALAEDAEGAEPTIGGKAVAGGKAKAGTPVFTNALKPGSLKVTKSVANPEDAPEGAAFRFRVELENDEGSPVDLDLSSATAYPAGHPDQASPLAAQSAAAPSMGGQSADPPRADPAPSVILSGGPEGPGVEGSRALPAIPDPLSALASLLAPEKAHAAEGDLEGTAYAIYDEATRTLVFFRSSEPVTTGTAGTEVTVHGKAYKGIVWTGFETAMYGYGYDVNHDGHKDAPPWIEDGPDGYSYPVAQVVFLDPVKPKSLAFWFGFDETLVSLEGLEYLDTSDAQSMEYMFAYFVGTGIDLSSFDTSAATSMEGMFEEAANLTELDLSSFDTGSVRLFDRMFRNAESLATIIAANSFGVDGASSSRSMFSGCLSLVGGANTAYDRSRIDGSYAHIVGGASDPGYFTAPRGYYTLVYHANDGTENSLAVSSSAIESASYAPASTFARNGYRLSGWATSSGAAEPAYLAGGVIAANAYGEGSSIDLYAVWEPVNKAKRVSAGSYELEIEGGMTAELPGVPAGTAYRVYEETPAGWVLASQSNAGGTIAPTEASEAVFTNRYQPGATSASLRATKTLDGAPASGFEFALYEAGSEEPLQTKAASGGVVLFDPISYVGDAALGEHAYEIREVAGADARITYDSHAEEVTVTVAEDASGNLTAAVAYDSDGASFANYTNPGSLRVTKTVEGTDAADKDFTFQVQLRDPKGRFATDEVEYYILDADGAVVDPSTRPASLSGMSAAAALQVEPVGASSSSPAGEAGTPQPATASQAAPTSPLQADPAPSVILSGGPEGPGVEGSRALPATPDPLSALASLLVPEKAYAAEGDLEGTAYAILVSEPEADAGALLFFRSSESIPTNAAGTEVTIHGKPYKGKVWTGFETSFPGSFDDVPWTDRANRGFANTTRVEFLDAVRPMSTAFWFCSSYAEDYDLEKLDTSNVTDMRSMFNQSKARQLDLSGFDTSNVTNMSDMFEDCDELTSLDVSSFDTGEVANMHNMFNGCELLPELDVSSFDVSGVTDMYCMFSGCKSLTELDLTSFNTSSVANMDYMFSYCSNLTTIYATSAFDASNPSRSTGEDDAYFFYDCSKLVGGQGSECDGEDHAGIEYAHIDGGTDNPGYFTALQGRVVYHANDGTSNHTLGYCPEGGSLTLAEPAERPGYTFAGWNTLADGSGIGYEVGDELPVEGTVDLYAQWRSPSSVSYTVRHLQQDLGADGAPAATYTVADTKALWAEPGDEVTPSVREYEGFTSPAAQTVAVAGPSGTTVVEYRYDRETYSVRFDGNGATGGRMADEALVPEVARALTPNSYVRAGYVFDGWNDEPGGGGTAYADGQPVKDLASAGESKTLYAQWVENPTDPAAPSSEGVVTVRLRAGDTLVFPSLPDGTTYSVAEADLPRGYALQESSGATGAVSANAASVASFANAYSAAGSVNLAARKALAGRDLAAGEFDFQLSETAAFADGDILDTASNGADGSVRFGAVAFDAPGAYTYYIRELAGPDADIVYDGAVYSATVEVSDNGDGTLSAGEPAYAVAGGGSVDEALFENSVRTGTLTVTKELENATAAARERSFDFTVDVRDAGGAAYAGALAYAVAGADGPMRAGAMHSGDVVSLSASETLVVSGIPYGCSYGVSEADADGFELVGAVNAEGTVSAAAPDATASFTNRYSSYGEALVTVTKALSGRELAGGQFTFLLLDEEGNEVARAANDADGNVAFPAIGFTEADDGVERAYTVVERDDAAPGYSYVTTGKRVTVTPADDGHGNMACEPAFEGGDSAFVNSYSASGELTLAATKTLSGRDLADGQFQFQVKDAAGRVVATGTNDADGAVELGPISFTEADAGKTVTLYVSEVDDGKPGYTYDARVVPVAVTVADDGNGGGGDGTLSLTLPEGLSISFANAFAPEGSADVAFRKVLTGRGLAAGEFAFSLVEVDEAGEPVPGAGPLTATNAADGTVAFPALYYGAGDAGTHRYVATEVVGSDATITYDDAELAVVVEVAETGGDELSCAVTYPDGQVFENAYAAPPAPDDPDDPAPPAPAPDGPVAPADNPATPAAPADPKVRPARSGAPATGDALPALAVGALALAALAALALSRRRAPRGSHARK